MVGWRCGKARGPITRCLRDTHGWIIIHRKMVIDGRMDGRRGLLEAGHAGD